MASQKKFGTFLGVYLPSILTVLGLIMYLRFGWVVGNLGLGGTLLCVLLANIITFITGLSASAIATNIRVGVGGVYYLVSRSLGLETGGAIGVAFYISRTLSITFYCFGLTEALLIFWPDSWGIVEPWMTPAISAAIIVLITAVSARSAELVLKFQIPMLILVALSILALIIGVLGHDLTAPEWRPTYRTEPGGFWVIFAVFFPGVTGFLAGIAMSGDLKNPGKSIPEGTIKSVITGFAIYCLIPILLSITALITVQELADPNLGIGTWTKVALFGGALVYPAAWGAILSSAIGSVLSGPRVLQSLSMDGLAPKFLSKTSKTGQPFIATWVTGGIAIAAVMLGNLNTVAAFVTVLFLTLYVVINLVAAFEQLVGEPSYRPKIHVPWFVSILGALGALFVMYLISPIALLLAVGLELACYIYFRKKTLQQSWGDVYAGFWMRIARFALLRIGERPKSVRNWRPLILLFVSEVADRIELVKLAAAFGQNKGVLSISKLVMLDDPSSTMTIDEMTQSMQADLSEYDLQAFCEVHQVHDITSGIMNVALGHGLSGMKTNTVIFGWSGSEGERIKQLQIIRALSKIGKNIILARFNTGVTVRKDDHKRIDLWWRGQERNGDLMLILAYMLQLNTSWEDARIHIHTIVKDDPEGKIMRDGIQGSLESSRISASIHIHQQTGRNVQDIITEKSIGSDIVFFGLRNPEPGNETNVSHRLEPLSMLGKIVVFIQNNDQQHAMPTLLGVKE